MRLRHRGFQFLGNRVAFGCMAAANGGAKFGRTSFPNGPFASSFKAKEPIHECWNAPKVWLLASSIGCVKVDVSWIGPF